jgi:hypothetical protein
MGVLVHNLMQITIKKYSKNPTKKELLAIPKSFSPSSLTKCWSKNTVNGYTRIDIIKGIKYYYCANK